LQYIVNEQLLLAKFHLKYKAVKSQHGVKRADVVTPVTNKETK